MPTKNKETSKTEDAYGERVVRMIFPNVDFIAHKMKRIIQEFDPARPHAMRAKFRKVLSAMLPGNELGQRLLVPVIKRAMQHPDARKYVFKNLEQLIATTKTEAKKDKRYSLLLDLIRNADKKIPFAGCLVSARHGDADQWFEIQMNSHSKIDRARSLKGELRADAVRLAYRDTVDYIYTPYQDARGTFNDAVRKRSGEVCAGSQ
jgi:hypothetical protein